MARTKPREIGAPSAIRPVASPVEAYVRPAEPARSQLHDLAKGLAGFDEGLTGFLQQRQAKQKDADLIRGEAAFNKANRVGWEEAVRQGIVPPTSSPYFMQGYKKAQGDLAGVRLQNEFQAAYLQWDGRNSDDPAAFDGFVSGFLKDRIGTEDADVLRGLNPHVDRLVQGGYAMWGKERANATYSGAVATSGGLMGADIDERSDEGLQTGEGTNYEGLWGSLMSRREEALGTGMVASDVDAQMVDAIIAKAIEHGDPQLLDLLDKNLPGSDLKVSDMPDFRDAKQAAIEKLEGKARAMMTDEARAQKARDQKAEDAIVRGVSRGLYEDPNFTVPEEVMREWEKYDPEARKTYFELRKSLSAGDVLEDDRAKLDLYEQLRGGGTEADINQAVRDGIIRTPESYKAAHDFLEKYRSAQERGSSILKSDTLKRFKDSIKARTAVDDYSDPFGVKGAFTDDALRGIQDLETMALEWDLANPNASQMERERAINEMGEMILGRIDTEERSYTPEAETAAEETLPDSTQSEPEAADPNAAPGLDTLSPERRQLIERQANQLGIDPEELNKRMWDKVNKFINEQTEPVAPEAAPETAPAPVEPADAAPGKLEPVSTKPGMMAPDGTPIVNAGYEPANDDVPATAYAPADSGVTEAQQAINDAFGEVIDSGLRGAGDYTEEARQYAPVLDLLGHTEGTDRGTGYNETLAYGKLTDGVKTVNKIVGEDLPDLQNMTLDEIDALQTKMLKDPDNKWNSTAVGRYQVIRTTLRSLRKTMGLSGDELYSKELQDRIGIQLLKGRGLDDWLAGSLSDENFMRNLAKEWASLPMVNGKGYYSGQGVGTDSATFLSTLTAMRDGTSTFTPTAYAKIPKGELSQFMQWNSDPIANHEKNLASIEPKLADVVRRAQEISGLNFVAGSGVRDKDLQKKAVEWGWSGTLDSNHLHGDAVDLWPIDEDGAVSFDTARLKAVSEAMKKAAEELGVSINWGGDWKKPDRPHFELS